MRYILGPRGPRGEDGAAGAQGPAGAAGAAGAAGDTGPGVAAGGSTDQYLKKASGTDYDTSWATLGAVSTYTPAITRGTTSPTLGTGNAKVGRYIQVGKLVTVWINIWLGGAGFAAGSGTIFLSLPVAAKTDAAWASGAHGTGYVYNGAATYAAVVALMDNSYGGDKVGVNTLTGLGSPTLASNGAVQLTMTYEAL